MLRGYLAVWRCALALACAAVPLNAEAQAIDSTLQDALTRAMATQRGAAVVLNVHSGRVLASSHLDVAARLFPAMSFLLSQQATRGHVREVVLHLRASANFGQIWQFRGAVQNLRK